MMFSDDDGAWAIHVCGPTSERAYEGDRSFKIDVEWLDPSWDCWRPLPLVLVYRGNPKVRARILVERGSGRLGHPYSTKEQGPSGLLVAGKEGRSPNGDWIEWEATADGKGEGGEFLRAPLVWVRPDPMGRTTVYIDDVEVEGPFSPAELERVSAEVRDRVSLQQSVLSEEVGEVEDRFVSARRAWISTSAELPESSQPAVTACRDALIAFLRQSEAAIRESLNAARANPARAKLAEIRRSLRLFEKASDSIEPLLEYARSHPEIPYVVWRVDAVTDERVLPRRLPVPGVVKDQLFVRGCPGEYEPATFAVTYVAPIATKDAVLESLLVEPTDAKCGDRVLAASAIDVRHVKCWWQAGVPIADLTHPSLTPELLLKDPLFVTVDEENK